MTDKNRMDQKADDLRTQKQPDKQERDKLSKSSSQQSRQPNQSYRPEDPNHR
jgi:hypothetical protein